MSTHEDVMRSYESLHEADRPQRRSDDAERITGEVARHLAAARTRLAGTIATTSLARDLS